MFALFIFVWDKVNNIFEFHLKIKEKHDKILTLLMFEEIVYEKIRKYPIDARKYVKTQKPLYPV